MSVKVVAYRYPNGSYGVEVGIMEPRGWDNVVTSIYLSGPDEVEAFVQEVREALERARTTGQPFSEELPGPYDGGWD